MFSELPPESICIVRLSHIGDTCHALAVVRTIQDTWPETNLTWIIGKTEASLMADIPGIEFIIFDKSKGRLAYRELHKTLANRRFDVALCMHASMRVNRICRIIDTPVRLGFDKARERLEHRRSGDELSEHFLFLRQFGRRQGLEKRLGPGSGSQCRRGSHSAERQ